MDANSLTLPSQPVGYTGSDHSLVYQSKSGAIVVAEAEWTASNATELPIAMHIANAGMDVILRNTVGVEMVKTPDAFVRTLAGWQEWEFKTVGKGSSLHTSVQKNLRVGRFQAPNVLLYMPDDLDDQGGLLQIRRGIGAAIFHDADGLLGQIIMMTHDGKMQIGNVDDINSGKFLFTEF